MADEPVNSILSGEESDEGTIPGAQDDSDTGSLSGGTLGQQVSQGFPAAQSPAVGQPGAPGGLPMGQPAAPSAGTSGTPPKASGRAFFLGNLLKTILSGVQNAPGNPNNAFDRGFMQASPNAQAMQQAQISKVQSEADIAKVNASRAQLQLLLTKHMVDRLPQDEQDKYIQMSNDYYKLLVDKEGLEVESTGDPKAAQERAGFKNRTDSRVKGGEGSYVPLIHRDAQGNLKSSVVWMPNHDVLQNDFDMGPNPNFDPDKPESDENPKELIIKAGTPNKGLPQMAKNLISLAQGDTKDQHKELAKLNNLPEDNPNQIQAKSGQLQQWINDKANDSTFKKHNVADVQATINRLKGDLPAAEQRKISEAKAMATQVTIPAAVEKAEGIAAGKRAENYYHWVGSDGETKVGKGKEVPEGVEATPIGGEKEFAQYSAESHISNIVQQSLNRVHQDIDQHPEVFDNAAARNIMATTLEQIDRSQAGLLIAGTGGSIPLPSGMGAMINTALQNKSLDPTTADALKQYIADYKAMKDKAISMQMEMQGGKIGRGSAQAFKSITDQIPNGETADSRTAHRQMNNLQETQDDLSKKYGDYGDFKKLKAYKPMDKGQSSTDIDREKKWEEAGGKKPSLLRRSLDLPFQVLKKAKEATEEE